MQQNQIREEIEANPIIMAVKDREGVARAKEMDSKVVFVLFGNLCNIAEIVRDLQEAGKIVIVHVDLIAGLGTKEVAVDFLKEQTGLDGIISTRPALVKRGKELGLFTILRFFMLDSMALESLKKQERTIEPDMIEMLPGVMPRITRRLTDTLQVPLICGGLISDKEDIVNALQAGAVAVSSTNPAIWEL